MTSAAPTPVSLELRTVIESHLPSFHHLLKKYGAKNLRLFGSVARGTAHAGSDIDILVEMDPQDGNILMRASGLLEETRELLGRDDIDIFPVQLLKTPVSIEALNEAVPI